MSKAACRNVIFGLGAAAVTLLAAAPAFATDPTAKWCAGVKIAAFPGGPQGGVFANNVYNGFRQAELDLGPTVTYYFSDWDPNKMLTQIQQALATKVDGIATYGFGGEAAEGPLVDQAYKQGTIFTSLNTALPDSQKKWAPHGFGYVGAPNYLAGFSLAQEAAKRAKLAKGDEVFVWGLKGQGGDRGQRTVGVVDAFTKAGAKVIYQEIDSATNADPNAGTATFVGVMKANPKVKIVVTDHGGLTSNVGVYARAASLKPGQVFFAGFDMSPNTAQAVKQGYQNLVIDQQPYLQGYIPILNICLTKKFGFSG
ncbi:MAG: substrate-binding domain-containing protein, partial [Hyphomicrobiales bacterium]|nr:substrate-binding domain-containing protein [Hyphomicrobiales bacterium]